MVFAKPRLHAHIFGQTTASLTPKAGKAEKVVIKTAAGSGHRVCSSRMKKL
jgi:hypothetical protein